MRKTKEKKKKNIRERINPLSKQKLGRMFNMIIRERSHRKITVIVIGLVPNRHALHARLLGSFLEVLGKKLTLLVEVVAGAL